MRHGELSAITCEVWLASQTAPAVSLIVSRVDLTMPVFTHAVLIGLSRKAASRVYLVASAWPYRARVLLREPDILLSDRERGGFLD